MGERDEHIWVIPANLNYYRLHDAFRKLGDKLDWHMSNSTKNIQVGDTVYIYVGRDEGSIRYKCEVTKTNLYMLEIDDREFCNNLDVNDGEYFEIKKIKKIPTGTITLEMLRKHGIKMNIQGPQRLLKETVSFIESVLNR